MEGNFDLYLVDSAGGAPQRLTTNPAEDRYATFAPDGRSVYFASRRTGDWEIWRMDLASRVEQHLWHGGVASFYRDPDGFYHYCGRADDMLKVSGMWVSPLEVENALLAHPVVAEAAVVGRRDPDGLTQIIAHIVLRNPACHPEPSEGSQMSESLPLADELRAFVKQQLPGYKVPQYVEFVSDLPKTATGKIQRFKLRT